MAADPLPDREDWHEPMLRELAEIGMDLARGLLRPEAAGGDPQLAFARVSRAVRQTVALNAHLRRRRQEPETAQVDEAPMDQARGERVVARVKALCRKSELAGRLTAAIEIEAERGERERLLRDLDGRLDVAVNTVDFLARPLGEVIAEIRHDLGLGPAAAEGGVDDDDQDLEDEDPGEDGPGEGEPPWLDVNPSPSMGEGQGWGCVRRR